MSVSNLIRNPIATALLGAAAVGVPAGALYLYGSEPHAAEVATVPAAALPAPATAATNAVRAGLPDFRGLVERPRQREDCGPDAASSADARLRPR